MTITHTSRGTPTFEQHWDPDDVDWIWIGWQPYLGDASFTSTWILPADWTNNGEQADQSVVDLNGRTITRANGVLLSTTLDNGTHTITNRVTLSDGRTLDRSVRIQIAGQ